MFVLLNRIFHCFKKYFFSKFLRIYSFWLQLMVIIIMSNSNKISFYIANYFELLFSLTFNYKMLHAVSISMVGLFIIVLVSFYYLNLYFCKDLSKYFLGNMYRVHGAYGYCTLRYSIKPLIDASVHTFLY